MARSLAGPDHRLAGAFCSTWWHGDSAAGGQPKGALIAIYAEVEMRSTGGAGNNAQVFIHEPTLFPNAARILSGSHNQFRIRRTAPGPDAEGVTSRARGGWIVLASNPGVKTFTLRYRTTGGTAIFKNRKLWVSVIS